MITKTLLEKFREDFAEAVKGLEKKYNSTILLTRIGYEETYFHGKIVVTLQDSKSVEENEKKANEHIVYYGKIHFPDLGMVLNAQFKQLTTGKIFTLKDVVYKKRKYPLIMQCEGKRYQLSSDQFKKLKPLY